MKQRKTVEDYLKAVYLLQSKTAPYVVRILQQSFMCRVPQFPFR